MVHTRRVGFLALGVATLVAVGGSSTAVADPIGSGTASAFAITAALNGTEVIPPTPTAETTAPAADETDATVIGIPRDPLVVSGTLIARSVVHTESDLASELEQSAQTVAGPYNARAIGQIEGLNVLMNEGIPGGQLLSADLLRGEAVAVCTGGAVQYSAESEVVSLQIGDQDPLSGPLNDLVDEITGGISASPLADLIDVDVNVLTVTPQGASVDALVVTVLAAAGETPLAQIRIGHAEVTGVACGGPLSSTSPECSDTIDNADAEDTLADIADPGCHTDGDALNASSYDPADDDETDAAAPTRAALPSTGAAVPTALATGLGMGALGLLALRRRLA